MLLLVLLLSMFRWPTRAVLAPDAGRDPHYRQQILQVRKASLHAVLSDERTPVSSSSTVHYAVEALARVGVKTLTMDLVWPQRCYYTTTNLTEATMNREDLKCQVQIPSLSFKPYDIQITLSNSIVPTMPASNSSRINLHICTSALATVNLNDTAFTSSYDYILLPSSEQRDQALIVLQKSLIAQASAGISLPSIPTILQSSPHPSSTAFIENLEAIIVDGIMSSDFRAFTRSSLHSFRRASYDIVPQRFTVPNPASVSTTDPLIRARSKAASSVRAAPATCETSLRCVAVIVEPRITQSLEIAVRNVANKLSRWGLQIHCSDGPGGSMAFLKAVLLDLRDSILFVPLTVPVTEEWQYNRLLKSFQFWEYLSFTADTVLIFQSDTLLFSTVPADYLQYAFVGSPWSINFEASSALWLKRLQRHGHAKNGVGNGGLSLRDVRAMKAVSESFGCDVATYATGK